MTAAFWTGWPGIDFRWRPGVVGIVFACGNIRRRKRERNAARGVVANEAWRNREALMPLVDWGPVAAVPRGDAGTVAADCSGAYQNRKGGRQNVTENSELQEKSGIFRVSTVSGGKDSTALLILMIEKGMPLDCVINADTGMEFPEMYEHLAKLDEYLFRERGIHITTLRHPKGFEYLMFEQPKTRARTLEKRARLGLPPYGNGWPGIKVRWCTGQLKTHLIEREVRRLKREKDAIHYVGIAADEAWRCKEEQYPLVDWGVTEAQALQICYDRGFDFGGLYQVYRRASCWLCPLQRLGELRKLRTRHPELWKRLTELDERARAQFGSSPLGQFKPN